MDGDPALRYASCRANLRVVPAALFGFEPSKSDIPPPRPGRPDRRCQSHPISTRRNVRYRPWPTAPANNTDAPPAAPGRTGHPRSQRGYRTA